MSRYVLLLLSVESILIVTGVCGYHQVIALRAVQSEDFMTADW